MRWITIRIGSFGYKCAHCDSNHEPRIEDINVQKSGIDGDKWYKAVVICEYCADKTDVYISFSQWVVIRKIRQVMLGN